MAKTSAAAENNMRSTSSSSVQDPIKVWWESLPTWEQTSARVQELTKDFPSWSEATEIVQQASGSTVNTVRKSTASTLRDTADRLEEASKSTAAKMREAAPWVAGDELDENLVSMENLRKGETVFWKGALAEVVFADRGKFVVRTCASNAASNQHTGTASVEVDVSLSTDVSLSIEASQRLLAPGMRVCIVGLQNRPELNGCHGSITEFIPDVQRWHVEMKDRSEIIRANPANLSVRVAPCTTSPIDSTCLQSMTVGANVRLQGLNSRPELNGRKGKLLSSALNERWHVQLESPNETVAVHVRNIAVVA